MTNYVYADFAASTPTDPEVIQAMLPYFKEKFANPSSIHSVGKEVSLAVEVARDSIAEFLGAKSSEVYFTGSGTESNNLAILGVAKANIAKGKHIITTNIEHPSIINACRNLEQNGWKVTYLPVNERGELPLDDLEAAISPETVLIALSYGNNEIGTIFDIPAVAAICHKNNVLLHVDACQSAAYLPINISSFGADLLTFNGSKIYGPKGIAVLFVRTGVEIFPVIYGGGQERSLRSGTHNVPGIIGLAKACELTKKYDSRKITELRDNLQIKLEQIPNIVINCSQAQRLPNHLSVTVDGLGNRDLVKDLDSCGVEVSSGSACSSNDLGGSHVLQAIGLSPEKIQTTIRITLGRSTTEEDCNKIEEAVAGLRN